jgi:hypothetical protein
MTPDWTDELMRLVEQVTCLERALGAELIRLQECELALLDRPPDGRMETMRADGWPSATDLATIDLWMGATRVERPN